MGGCCGSMKVTDGKVNGAAKPTLPPHANGSPVANGNANEPDVTVTKTSPTSCCPADHNASTHLEDAAVDLSNVQPFITVSSYEEEVKVGVPQPSCTAEDPIEEVVIADRKEKDGEVAASVDVVEEPATVVEEIVSRADIQSVNLTPPPDMPQQDQPEVEQIFEQIVEVRLVSGVKVGKEDTSKVPVSERIDQLLMDGDLVKLEVSAEEMDSRRMSNLVLSTVEEIGGEAVVEGFSGAEIKALDEREVVVGSTPVEIIDAIVLPSNEVQELTSSEVADLPVNHVEELPVNDSQKFSTNNTIECLTNGVPELPTNDAPEITEIDVPKYLLIDAPEVSVTIGVPELSVNDVAELSKNDVAKLSTNDALELPSNDVPTYSSNDALEHPVYDVPELSQQVVPELCKLDSPKNETSELLTNDQTNESQEFPIHDLPEPPSNEEFSQNEVQQILPLTNDLPELSTNNLVEHPTTNGGAQHLIKDAAEPVSNSGTDHPANNVDEHHTNGVAEHPVSHKAQHPTNGVEEHPFNLLERHTNGVAEHSNNDKAEHHINGGSEHPADYDELPAFPPPPPTQLLNTPLDQIVELPLPVEGKVVKNQQEHNGVPTNHQSNGGEGAQNRSS